MLDIGLLDEDLLGSIAESLDFRLLDVLALLELFNPLVDVE